MTEQVQLVEQYLTRALAQYEITPQPGKWIGELASEFPDLFGPAALSIVRHLEQSPGEQFLISLLLRQPKLFHWLTDPWNLTREEAVTVFKRFLKLQQWLDIRLAGCLRDRQGQSNDGLTVQMLQRALEILDESPRPQRLLPMLRHLLEHPEATISAKATLMIGRMLQRPEWSLQQLTTRSDHRARANALQALWGVERADARRLMQGFVHDAHHRVASASLFGLALLHEVDIREQVLEMADSANPSFRSSAAWLMGKTHDAGYVPLLSSLIHDTDARVRSAALKALLAVRHEGVGMLK